MRIGVLTYHCVPNFGAQLQAMSTVGYLKRMGHTPVLLHWYPKDLEDVYRRRVSKEQIVCQMQFAEDNFPLSSLCRNEKQLIKEIEKQQLDMIITGSDALFRYVPKCDRKKSFSKRRLRFINNFVSSEDLEGNPFFCDYYGELSRQIPVVAFSVSSQSTPYQKMDDEEKNLMGKYLRNFSKITVRDTWTKKMVEDVSGLQDIQVTPDPVFSFNQNCFIQVPTKNELLKRFSIPDNYVLFSFSSNLMENEYLHRLMTVFSEKGYVPVGLPEPEGVGNYSFEYNISLPLNPIDWYALIKNASGYIGTRMHPIIVSLHNSTPFFSFDGNGIFNSSGVFVQESSKIFDILKNAGLEANTYPLRSGWKLPLADNIVNSIFSFDKNLCDAFALHKYEDYQLVMEYILN